MQAIRSILVVIEPDQLEGLALKRAQLIAGVTQSHLHLLVCEKRRDHSAALNDLAQELREEGYSVSTNQAWKDSLHQTIIAEQQAEGCGLIIKQHFPDNPLKKAILTPDDWKLLRFAPCPVLMTKTARPWTGGKILAAVDVGNNDGEHRSLHAGIISHAYDIAGLAKATLHVISAHPSPLPGCSEVCETLPTCQSWAKMRPPAACTASVTWRQPATCSALWMPGVQA